MEETVMFGDGPEFRQFLDASYVLMEREIQSLDRIVYNVVRHKAVAQKMFPTVKIPEGMKQHKVAIEVEADPPKFDDNFLTEDLDEIRKEEKTFYPIYMHKDFAIDKVTIDASRSSNYYNLDAKALQLRGSTNTIVDYKERVIWRGYDIKGRSSANAQGSIDDNSKGILNTSNVQSFAAGAGADANITAAGDGPASIGAAVATLVDDGYYGPYYFIMTPLVRSALGKNLNSTTHITDIERMQSMVDENGNKILRGMFVTPYLINATETSSTGSMVMIDPKTPMGEPTVVIGEVYPVTHYPTSQNSLFIKGKIIWAGCAMVLRPKAITIETDITSS